MNPFRPSVFFLPALLAPLCGAVSLTACSPERADPDISNLTPGAFPRIVLEGVTTGLADPVAITHASDSRLFITLRGGKIVIWDGARIVDKPFLDIGALISSGGERGLLSTAFHPRYAENGLFFVNYTNTNGDTVIARYRVSSDPDSADAGSGVILLTIAQPFANHNGGQLQFGPDGFLYIGMGDGGSKGDPQLNGQRDDTLLGKMLRIDVDAASGNAPFYSVPASNPVFAGRRGEVWAKGLRNPWRFSFDRATGDLYIGDVGQDAREEIDFQPAASAGGENYGWNVMEGLSCFSTEAVTGAGAPPCNDPRLTLPILDYGRDGGNCSVIGGYVYRGARVAGLQGVYVYGDFCSGTLWGARRENGAWITHAFTPQTSKVTARIGRLLTNWGVARTFTPQAPQLTSFGEDAAGELYLATLDGALYRMAPEP